MQLLWRGVHMSVKVKAKIGKVYKVGTVVPDVKGGRLLLTKTTLTELTGYRYGPFRMSLGSLRLRRPGATVYATASAVRNTVQHAWINIDYDECVIGCRMFSVRTFAKILKMADAS
jgi:hypothetical protein